MSIQQQTMISASPAQVYAVLADAAALSALSGMPGVPGRSAGAAGSTRGRPPDRKMAGAGRPGGGQASRLLGLLMDGLRAGSPEPAR